MPLRPRTEVPNSRVAYEIEGAEVFGSDSPKASALPLNCQVNMLLMNESVPPFLLKLAVELAMPIGITPETG